MRCVRPFALDAYWSIDTVSASLRSQACNRIHTLSLRPRILTLQFSGAVGGRNRGPRLTSSRERVHSSSRLKKFYFGSTIPRTQLMMVWWNSSREIIHPTSCLYGWLTSEYGIHNRSRTGRRLSGYQSIEITLDHLFMPQSFFVKNLT